MRTRLLTAAAVAALLTTSATGCSSDDPVRARDVAATQPTTAAAATTAPSTTGGRVIPDDFPLLDGYPPDSQAESGDSGRHGPSRDLDPLRFESCGTTLPVPEAVDRLRAGWSNPEDYRDRELAAFASEAGAERFVRDVEDLYAGCPREDTDDGYTSVNSLVDGSLGDETVTHVRRYELDGAPAIGLLTTTLVRVGSWVLVSSMYNEGMARDGREAQEAAARSEAAVADLVAEMESSA